MKKKPVSLKETRPYLAVALFVQSVAFFIMFLILCVKKKSIAAAFLAVSAMEGVSAAYLFLQMKEDALAAEEDFSIELDETDFPPESPDEEKAHPFLNIPKDESASEDEFLA